MLFSFIGIVLVTLAFARFRKPGKRFWVFVPIWKLREHLTPDGCNLCYLGGVALFVGVLQILF